MSDGVTGVRTGGSGQQWQASLCTLESIEIHWNPLESIEIYWNALESIELY